MTVSLRAARHRHAGARAGRCDALPAFGTLGLLLSCTLLCMKTQHEWVCVIGLMPLFGQAPFCGAGGSPLIWVLVSKPSWLLSNSEFSMTIAPPELVPE